MWERVLAGEVTTIGSDHSPSPPEMKRNTNFFKVWGGISGVQHLLPLLIGAPEAIDHFRRERAGETPALSAKALSLIAKLTSFNVAERFGLPKTKGRIAIGADADFALVDFREKYSVRAEDLFYRHKQSPYVGRTLTGRVVQTILRGQTIFKRGQIVSQRRGQLIETLYESETRSHSQRHQTQLRADHARRPRRERVARLDQLHALRPDFRRARRRPFAISHRARRQKHRRRRHRK